MPVACAFGWIIIGPQLPPVGVAHRYHDDDDAGKFRQSICLVPGDHTVEMSTLGTCTFHISSFEMHLGGTALINRVDVVDTAKYHFAVPVPGPCPSTQVDNSDHAAVRSISGSTGDVVTVTCDAGYIGGGDAVCGAGGLWAGLTACTVPGPCPSTQVDNSDHAALRSISGSTGDVVTVTCDAGYIGGGDAVCGAGGLWAGLTDCTGCVKVIVGIQSVGSAGQVGWTISGLQPPVGVAFGTYSWVERSTQSVCLVPGEHIFEAKDSTGAGWNGGTFDVYLGEIALIDRSGVSGSGSNHSFTVPVPGPCPSTQVDNSDHAALRSISGSTGDVVTVTCDAGYIGGGDAVCGAGGLWAGLTACTDRSGFNYVGIGCCREADCHSCSSPYDSMASCVDHYSECIAKCMTMCVGIAYAAHPLSSSDGCELVGRARCVVYLGVVDVGGTKGSAQEYMCYRPGADSGSTITRYGSPQLSVGWESDDTSTSSSSSSASASASQDSETDTVTVTLEECSSNVRKVIVFMKLIGTWSADLVIKLSHLGVADVLLMGSLHGAASWHGVLIVFDDDAAASIANNGGQDAGYWRPEESLTAFKDLPAAGDWTLTVIDLSPAWENHYVEGWGITVTCDSSSSGVDRCVAEVNWPDVDHGLVCGDCRVLVNNMASTYLGLCDNYCQSFGRQCVGAWEESSDSCTVQSTGSCSISFGSTSDAICECSADETGLNPSLPPLPLPSPSPSPSLPTVLNLALNQFTEHVDWAMNAVDGNKFTQASSTERVRPRLKITLAEASFVQKVVVWNTITRDDRWEANPFWIKLLDSAGHQVASRWFGTTALWYPWRYVDVAGVKFVVVHLDHVDPRSFHLAEVEVFGYAGTPPSLEADCGVPIQSHWVFHGCTGNNQTYGGSCSVSCEVGYIGRPRATCFSSGSWAYTGSCSLGCQDGVLNGDESFVDCGGSCTVCGPSKTMLGHTGPVKWVSFSPDGTMALSAAGSEDFSVRLWDVRDGTSEVWMAHTTPLYFAVFSPDGDEALSSAIGRGLRRWNVRTGTSERVIVGAYTHIREVRLQRSLRGFLPRWN